MIHKVSICLLVFGLAVAGIFFVSESLALETIVLEPGQDNTLYETGIDQDGQLKELSNGSGAYLFAGRTSLDAGYKLRRVLLLFDLASVLPADATIVSTQLSMYQSKAAPGSLPAAMILHRLLQKWGEAESNAVGPEGQGQPAKPGDATWHHRVYPDELWDTPGGSYIHTGSAGTTVGNLKQTYHWPCSEALLNDLRDWHEAPEINFGWIIIGAEAIAQNAHRFNSRENNSPKQRPKLTISYRTKDEIFESSFEQQVDCP